MNETFCFLESVVYHSRTGDQKNAFRYRVLNFVCQLDHLDKFKALLRQKFFRFLSIDDRSYMGKSEKELQFKADEFIQKNFQMRFEKIILQSMPKMGGYVFNPVSFWYCYQADQLKAVLCEVNNTFDEKHYYWLYQNGEDLQGQWLESEKQFHVSPFLKIEGKYRFRFLQTKTHFSSEIDYLDGAGNLKLKTWIKGVITPIENLSLSLVFLRYAWMTPLVVFRIHYQALRLLLKKVQFISKPTKPTQEISHESSIIRH